MNYIHRLFALPKKFNNLDEYTYRRCQVTNFYLVMYMIFFSLSAVLNIFYGFYAVTIVEMILVVLSMIFRRVLLKYRRIELTGWVTIILMATLILMLIFFRQGVQQSYINTLMFPIVAITILGYRQGIWASILYSGGIYWTIYYGSSRWDFHSVSEMYINMTLALVGVIGTMVYVDWTKEVVFKKLKIMSMRDSLTGLWNRKKFEEVIQRALNKYKDQGVPFSMMILDIDHFKAVNDTYGHSLGDEVLIAMSDRIRACIVADDVLVRWGGEEFALILHGMRLEEAGDKAHEILRAVNSKPFEGVGLVTVSIGYGSIQGRDTVDTKAFFREIDQALYRAKEAGRNRAMAIPWTA